MSTNIGKLTLLELRVLLEEIKAQIKIREKTVAAVRTGKEPQETGSKGKKPPKIGNSSLISAPEKDGEALDSGKTSSNESRPTDDNVPSSIKYMHPVVRSLCWDGLGKEPDWIQIYLDRGGSWIALENTAERFRRSLRKFELPKKEG